MAIVIDIHRNLVERCKQRDPRAQRELYSRYTRAMLHIAQQITRDLAEAEDVLQESFIRAFRNIDHFKGDSTFGAWLKRIVINTAINHIKKRRLHFVNLDDERFDLPQEEVQDYHPNWSMGQITAAISQLPEGYREVLNLYLLEGYDHKEISNILGISEATSKSQYCRARKKLREILTDNSPQVPFYQEDNVIAIWKTATRVVSLP